MATVPILKKDNNLSTVEVDAGFLGDKLKSRTLRQATLMYEANLRQGNASTKTRSEVAGTTKKPWRQKGTGRARVGTRKSPLWRGGGVTFGPRPRDFSQKMSKKSRKAALKAALLGKFQDNEVSFVEEFGLEKPSTKSMAESLKSIEVKGSCLIVLHEKDEVIWKSARNIPKTSVMSASDLNAYAVVRHKHLLVTPEGFEALKKRLENG